ncbi:hypothetical protein KEM56_000301 [Ascosphaera pollenicola]|nr:hypothetical protein KEM56_000301 [Ascosphaera pollenicola]
MRKPSVSQLVYRALYSKRNGDEPGSFAAHIGRYIVPELRVEVFNFYGNFEELEAKYPGLDYSYPPHRLRLGRFPHHRQLFQVFDELKLTKNEMYWLCSWEGTKLARDRFEKDQNRKVVDTTGDKIKVATPHGSPTVEIHEYTEEESDQENGAISAQMVVDVLDQSTGSNSGSKEGRYMAANCPVPLHNTNLGDRQEGEEERSEGYDDRDEQILRISATQRAAAASANTDPFGFSLGQRFMAANAARVSGQHDLPLDAAYEQWLKEEVETGGPSSQSAHATIPTSYTPSSVPSLYDDCLPSPSDHTSAPDYASGQERTSTPSTLTPDSMIPRQGESRRAREAQAFLDRRREELLRLNGADRQASPFITSTQASLATSHGQSHPSASPIISWTHSYGNDGYQGTVASSNPSLHYSLSDQQHPQLQQRHQQRQQQLEREFHDRLRQRQRLLQLHLLDRQHHARGHNATGFHAQNETRVDSRRRERNRTSSQISPD